MKFSKLSIAIAMTLVAGAAAAQSTTLGTGATAQTGVAIGNNATQANVTGDIFGTGTPVNYTGGIAMGNGAFAAGKNIAIGDGLQAIQDGVPNSYSLVIGGLNYNNGLVEHRRVVGMANGLFGTDGANLQQVWDQAAITLGQANAYTDASLFGVNSTLASHNTRINTAQATATSAYSLATVANTRLDAHDVTLGEHGAQLQNHETRITNLEGLVGGFDGRLSSLEAKVNQTRKQAFQGVAAVAAMNVEVPALAPGEQAVVAGVGAYGGQAALAVGYVRSNYAGQVFSAKVGVSGGRAALSAGGGWKF